MPALKPEDLDYMVVAAMNAGDLDAAMELYEDGATLVPEPGKIAMGLKDVREAMGGTLALKPHMTIEVPKVFQAGEIALLCSKWTLTGTGPDGSAINLAGQGTEVGRRQADGTWLFVIDNPFGVD